MSTLRLRHHPVRARHGAPVVGASERGQTMLQFLLFGAIIAIAWLGTVSFMGTPPTQSQAPPAPTTVAADAGSIDGCTQWRDAEAGQQHQVPGDPEVHPGPCP